MDTKLKNIRYSIYMKGLAVFLIWLSLAGLFSSFLYAGIYSDQIEQKNYYQTWNFGEKFGSYVGYAADLIDRQDPQTKANGTHTDTTQTQSDTAQAQTTPELTNVAGIEPEAIPQAVKDARKERAHKILDASANFKYIIMDTNGGIIANNIDVGMLDKLKSNKLYMVLKDGYLYVSEERFRGLMDARLTGMPYTFYAAVEDNLQVGDAFYDAQMEFNRVHALIPVFVVIAIFALLLGICSFVYLAAVAGRNGKDGEIKPALIDWLYNDLHTGFVILAAVLSVNLAVHTISYFNDDISKSVGIFALLTIDFLIGLSYILSMIRHIKRKTLFRHTLIYNLFKAITRILSQCFVANAFKPVTILLFLAFGGFNAVWFAIATHLHGVSSLLMVIVLFVIDMVAVLYVSKALASLSRIMKWVREMTKGNLEYSLDTSKMTLVFTAFVKDIGNLQAGIRQAVSEAVKGERLKTELITNVSHDLKTPLTSIINYVDLLKKENLDNETVNEYISVLDEKSGRLKQLIDDLLEVSKASSGDMTVSYGSVDLCSLVGQSMAEYSEKAAEAGLDVRVKMCEKPTVVHGDGTLMWRIMDNLLSNAVKYSRRNSRVYIDIEDTGTLGKITVKNISEEPLDMPSDQFLERFIRGDRSRSTEGSGLGLSIAKSLAEIQGGNLELSVDGDLFKVIVSLPLEAA